MIPEGSLKRAVLGPEKIRLVQMDRWEQTMFIGPYEWSKVFLAIAPEQLTDGVRFQGENSPIASGAPRFCWERERKKVIDVPKSRKVLQRRMQQDSESALIALTDTREGQGSRELFFFSTESLTEPAQNSQRILLSADSKMIDKAYLRALPIP